MNRIRLVRINELPYAATKSLHRKGSSSFLQRNPVLPWFLILALAISSLQCSKPARWNQTEQVDSLEIIYATDWSTQTATNLGEPVNSPEGEFNPEITSNGLEMFFSSERTGSAGRDLYRARRDRPDGAWHSAENLGPKINSPFLDSGPSITDDGLTLVFHSQRLFNGVGDGIQQHRDLFVTTRPSISGSFGEVRLVPGEAITTRYADTAALITDHGLTMYFSSNRPGGVGSKDIYVATRDSVNTFFSGVQNLGPNVNSQFVDSNPAVTRDGLALFFHSKRPGFGRSDLYVTHRQSRDAPWEPARNLGPSVNTHFAEANPSVSSDSKILLFRSDRTGTLGKQDIWQMPIQSEWLESVEQNAALAEDKKN